VAGRDEEVVAEVLGGDLKEKGKEVKRF